MTRLLSLFYVIGTLCGIHAVPVKRQGLAVAALNFVCTGHSFGDMTEVCKTMCYGINCLDYPAVMFWDKKAARGSPNGSKVGSDRSANACCDGKSRCKKAPYGSGWQCDEFPFKSVEPDKSGRVTPFNRCVPKSHNTGQGNVLKQFYYSQGSEYKNGGGLHDTPNWYKLAFQNYAGISYCEDASIRDCKNDGNLYYKNGLAYPKGEPQLTPPHHQYYLTKRRANLFIPAGAEIGDVVHSLATKDNGEDGDLELDEIVALANATSIAE